MNRKVNGHTAEFIRRQANKLKKSEGIPLHQALDRIAQKLGFLNYKEFIKKSEIVKVPKNSNQKQTIAASLPVSDDWAEIVEIDSPESRTRQISSGTLVKIKNRNLMAVVISYDPWNDYIQVYSDKGRDAFRRSEISVFRDQSQAKNFLPMRLRLPYGKWSLQDGYEVLFNRDYCPIWQRSASGEVTRIDPETDVPFEDEEFYFGDGSTPWNSKSGSRDKCLHVLMQWGIEDERSMLLELLDTAIADGSLGSLKLKKRSKPFYA